MDQNSMPRGLRLCYREVIDKIKSQITLYTSMYTFLPLYDFQDTQIVYKYLSILVSSEQLTLRY